MLGGDELVLEVVGLLEGLLEYAVEGSASVGLLVGTLYLGQPADGGVHVAEQLLRRHLHFFEHGQDDALAVLKEGREQVHGKHLRVAVFGGHLRGGLDGSLRLDGEFVPLDCHAPAPLRISTLNQLT